MEEEAYREKFAKLQPWTNQILNEVKKELKTEHLRSDLSFAKKHFAKKYVDKLTVEEMAPAYLQEINDGNEEVGEWIASRWVMKHADVYHLFSELLSQFNPKFDEIEEIPDQIAKKLLQISVPEHGARNTYIFCILNSVRLPIPQYNDLRILAEKEETRGEEMPQPVAEESAEEVKLKYEKELQRLNEKHEKKFLGFQKKYAQDVQGLKKQIAALQRKLNG